MTIEWVGGVPQGNYQQGRSGNVVALLIDHWIGTGTLDGAISHFQSPTAGTSAHFIVGTDGRIVQMLSTDDTAYQAGDFPTNLRSIGIEHEATPDLAPSDALYAASAYLHAFLANQYGIPLTLGITVRPHNSVISTQCPGTLDLARIVRTAMAFVTTEDFKAYQKDVADTLNAMKAAYDPLVTALAANGQLDAQQQAQIVTLQNRIDKLHSV